MFQVSNVLDLMMEGIVRENTLLAERNRVKFELWQALKHSYSQLYAHNGRQTPRAYHTTIDVIVKERQLEASTAEAALNCSMSLNCEEP